MDIKVVASIFTNVYWLCRMEVGNKVVGWKERVIFEINVKNKVMI